MNDKGQHNVCLQTVADSSLRLLVLKQIPFGDRPDSSAFPGGPKNFIVYVYICTISKFSN